MISAVTSFKANNQTNNTNACPGGNCAKPAEIANINSVNAVKNDSFQKQPAKQPSFGMNTFTKLGLFGCFVIGIDILVHCL